MAKNQKRNPKDVVTRDDDSRSNKSSKGKKKPYRGNDGRKRDPVHTNDISWYAKNPELLMSVARIPFPNRPGMAVDFDLIGDGHLDYKIPGVMAIKFKYSIGNSSDVNSPASIAAREMYGRIRSKFSGSLDEDAPDLFMYCIAIDQVHACIAHLKRIYKLISLYDAQNHDYPETILKAMGINRSGVVNLQKEKTAFYGMINELVNMANKFHVPNDMPIYERHRWMNENVFFDEPTKMAQTYVFVPQGFFKIDDTGANGTELKYQSLQISSGIGIAENYYNYCKGLINSLADWDDSYTILGHIDRAYEGGTFYTVPLLAQDEMLAPVYDQIVLSQIENSTAIGGYTNVNISQDPNSNAIIYEPVATYELYTADNVVNIHMDMPTAADLVEATRLTARVSQGTKKIYGGTEIVTGYSISGIGEDLDGSTNFFDFTSVLGLDTTNPQDVIDKVRILSRLRSFHYHPNILLRTKELVSEDPVAYDFEYSPFVDVWNFTTITESDLIRLNRVCIFSEFNCFNRT